MSLKRRRLTFVINRVRSIDLELVKHVNPGGPFLVEQLFHFHFLLFVNRRIDNSVQAQFLKVSNVQLPGERDIDVVERDAFIVEEARVIARNGALDSVHKEEAAWVHAEVKSVSEHHVAQRADFDADILLLHFLNQIRELAELEAMADALGVEGDGRVNIRNLGVVSLTCVEEARHVVDLLLRTQQDWGK